LLVIVKKVISRPRYWRCLWLCCQWTALSARAQDVTPRPSDLLGSATASEPSSTQLIEDPELGPNLPPLTRTAAPRVGRADADAPQSEVHMTLHTRVNRDFVQDYAREDVWESTSILTLDATLRRSENLRLGVGVMGRYHVASLAHSLPDQPAGRYELDALPTSGYVDATLARGLHVRAGYQPVALGRFDAFSASNVLSAIDLRDGAATAPGRPELGQLALLIDYDLTPSLSIRAIYIPFFTPHLVSVTDSDYALFRDTRSHAEIESACASAAAQAGLDACSEISRPLLRQARDRLAQSALQAFAPQTDLSQPQAALRATWHGSAGEISATVATALEHLPALRPGPLVSAVWVDPSATSDLTTLSNTNLLDVEYNRFALASIDAAIDVAGFSWGVELAYQFHRTLNAMGTGDYPNVQTGAGGDPQTLPSPGFSDVLHAGARVEYARSETWIAMAEGFAAYAMSRPKDSERSWMFLDDGRLLHGIVGLLGYTTGFGLTLQLSAAWLSGPSYMIAPRILIKLSPGLLLETGVFVIDGQTPPTFATPILSIGGLWNNLDHVFVGLRASL